MLLPRSLSLEIKQVRLASLGEKKYKETRLKAVDEKKAVDSGQYDMASKKLILVVRAARSSFASNTKDLGFDSHISRK